MEPASILIVEDETGRRKTFSSVTEVGAPEFRATATSGRTRSARRVTTHPDLILMDIVLKGKMDGSKRSPDPASVGCAGHHLTAYADNHTLEH